MSASTEAALDWIAAGFAGLEQALNGNAAGAVHTLRREAFESVMRLGFPSSKNEEWKYTNIQPHVRKQFVRAPGLPAERALAEKIAHSLPAAFGNHRAVFVDGFFAPELSTLSGLPQGVMVDSLQSILSGGDEEKRKRVVQHLARYAAHREQAFVALNTAFLADGAVIFAEAGAKCSEPIELLFIAGGESESEPRISSPRILIAAEDESEVVCIEHYVCLSGAANYLTNSVTEIAAADRAIVDHYKLQFEANDAVHVSTIELYQSSHSRVSTSSFSFGGRLVRNDVNPTLDGERIETRMNGLSVLTGEQHVDNHTVIDHAKPHCESNEWYKGIYSGRSKGVFNGTIIVRPDAQKTNAIQSNQSLLLSDEAESNAKPQLKIWADDVRCTHGATVGQLDEGALFYLRSRGIDRKTAQGMLIKAFAGDIIEKVSIEPMRDFLEQQLAAKLSAELA